MKRAISVTVFGLVTAIIASLFLSCSDGKSESRSMEQIYAEEGVPVRIREVVPQLFAVKLEYNAVLTGIEESSGFAAVDDKVDDISVSVGDYVSKDSVIVTFPTDNPTAGYYQAKTTFENAKATFNRMAGYYEAGGLSLQQFQDSEAQFKVAKANWDAVRQSIKVTAPIAGIVTKVNVRESDNVRVEDELFTISRTDRMKCHIWVPEKQINEFRAGQQASAVWNGTELTGRVTQVDMSINAARQAFGVILEFDNPNRNMQCGVTARVSVTTYTNAEAVATQRKNVLTHDSESYVFVARDGFAARQPVTLGASSGITVEILDGLAPGDPLIVEGHTQVDEGSKVRAIGDEPKHSSAKTSNQENH